MHQRVSFMLDFQTNKEENSIIQIIGVGGGGTNAVNHMHQHHIKKVEYVVCNTDNYSLQHSPIDNTVQLGPRLTEGLGAGSVPDKGEQAALESSEEIEAIFKPYTKMVFVTAGLGGGTGTGAAPVIVEYAARRDLLTVAVLTLPFSFEGKKRKAFAEEGLRKIRKHADAIIVIDNDNITKLYGNMTITQAFAMADDILLHAVQGVSDIVTQSGYVSVDFEDVNTVMRKSGFAHMGTGISMGDNRAIEALDEALASPLVSGSDIDGAQTILINISSHPESEITMTEFSVIQKKMQEKTRADVDVIFGLVEDTSLDSEIKITLIITGIHSNP